MQKKNILIFGGNKGFGNYICSYFVKKKYNVYSISRNKNLIKNHNVKSIKLDIFDKKTLNNFKLFILRNRIKFDNVFFSIGDHFKINEKEISEKLLKKLLYINVFFPINFINFLIKKKILNNTKFIFSLSDSLKNLRAKPSYIISKGACEYYIKSQAFFMKQINCSLSGIIIGPLLHTGSIWDNVRKENKIKFIEKKKTLKGKKFPKPSDYLSIIKILDTKSCKQINGKVFSK